MNAARGYGEVDGPAGARVSEAHVWASLENLHGESALRQGDCQQRTGETRANERYRVGTPLHVMKRRLVCGRIAAQAIILPDRVALPPVPGRISYPACASGRTSRSCLRFPCECQSCARPFECGEGAS